MCGICGYISDGAISGGRELVKRMAQRISHRGPDSNGWYGNRYLGMGFVRLAIIDLSDVANQPMLDETGRYIVCCNGEIFNYVELRDELQDLGHIFFSMSDTEVALKSYMEWGVECFNKFRGMWAMVIWDTQENRLVASRDPFGIKPLYFTKQNRTIFWASEIKAFLELPVGLSENIAVSTDYLEYGLLDFGQETFFNEVWQLQPGEIALISTDLEIEKYYYWSLEKSIPHPDAQVSEQGQICAFRNLLLEKTTIASRSDVPVWVLLSGGLDSSAIVSILHENYPEKQINAISIVHEDENINEYEYALDVAGKKNVFLEVVKIDGSQWTDDFMNLIYHQDEPVASGTAVNHWFLMKKIRKLGIKVVLSGQGIDEILYGYYRTFMGFLFADLASKAKFGCLFREIVGHARLMPLDTSKEKKEFLGQSLKGFFPQWVSKKVRSRVYQKTQLFLDPEKLSDVKRRRYVSRRIKTFDRLHNAFYRLLTQESIPRILRYEDRNSMAFSVEQRVPFLDPDIVSFLFSTQWNMKIRGGITKWIFRESLKGILPENVRLRKTKLGFNAPEARWLRSMAFQDFIKQAQLNEILSDSIINTEKFWEYADLMAQGKLSYNSIFWRIYNYALWRKEFGI